MEDKNNQLNGFRIPMTALLSPTEANFNEGGWK